MLLGRVIGTVVSTSKDERLIGAKLLLIKPLNENLEPMGNAEVVVDFIGAGGGEIVIYSKGSSARHQNNQRDTPIDAAVVGIVDTVDHS